MRYFKYTNHLKCINNAVMHKYKKKEVKNGY